MTYEHIPVHSTISAAKEAPALVKKIDKTTFVVRVHFSVTSKETMEDKVKRLLTSEIAKK